MAIKLTVKKAPIIESVSSESLKVGGVYKGCASSHYYLCTTQGEVFDLSIGKKVPPGGRYLPVSSAELIITD